MKAIITIVAVLLALMLAACDMDRKNALQECIYRCTDMKGTDCIKQCGDAVGKIYCSKAD